MKITLINFVQRVFSSLIFSPFTERLVQNFIFHLKHLLKFWTSMMLRKGNNIDYPNLRVIGRYFSPKITGLICVFSSPELKAQVSFSDHLSSGVCLSVRPSVRPSVCLSVCKLFTFSSSSPEPLGQFQPNLAQSILG